MNGVEEILITKRLRQELHCPGFHRTNCHGDVAVACNEDDRNRNVGAVQFQLKIQAAHPRQPNIKNQATQDIWSFGRLEFERRSKKLSVQIHRFQQIPESVPDGWIVLDNVYLWLGLNHSGFGATPAFIGSNCITKWTPSAICALPRAWKLAAVRRAEMQPVQSKISAFGLEMQDSSDFRPLSLTPICEGYLCAGRPINVESLG